MSKYVPIEQQLQDHLDTCEIADETRQAFTEGLREGEAKAISFAFGGLRYPPSRPGQQQPGLVNPITVPPSTAVTLRDLFAMAALSGLIAVGAIKVPSGTKEGLSEAAYEIADAMLAERSKP